MTSRRPEIFPVIAVSFAAACLGYWLFGRPGAALWGAIAASIALVLSFLRASAPRLSIVVPLLLAGFAMGHASNLGWGGAEAADGTRYKASPIGLSHVLKPWQQVSATEDCRWYLAGSRYPRCAMAVDAGPAQWQLMSVFPLVCLGILMCLLGTLGQRRAWQVSIRWTAWLAAAIATLALVMFSGSVAAALQDLRKLDVGIGGTLGVMEMTLAIVLCLAAGAVVPASSEPAGSASGRGRLRGAA